MATVQRAVELRDVLHLLTLDAALGSLGKLLRLRANRQRETGAVWNGTKLRPIWDQIRGRFSY
jgi:hypothetical protein